MTIQPEREEREEGEKFLPSCRIAEDLTRAYGTHPLAFFGLAPENEHFQSPEGSGLVHYRILHKNAIIPGDALCAPEAREQVTRTFLDFCTAQGWAVAFYQATAEFLETYRALKLQILKIGEEAMIDVQTFTLQGSALANVRTSCRRAEREGVILQHYDGVPPPEVMRQLEQISARWLRYKSGEQALEMGFSSGRLNDLVEAAERAERLATLSTATHSTQATIPRHVTTIATLSSGQACAFMTFTPIYGMSSENGQQPVWGWALDLMRRVPDAPPGVMELLLVRAIERFRLAGARYVSLGLVAWADSRQEMPFVQRRIAIGITERLGLFSSRHTLFRFKQKFQPAWQSRYLIVSTPQAWPQVILAILRLRNYAPSFTRRLRGGGDLVPPRVPQRHIVWQFLRYCLVGGVNTFLDLLILNLLLWRFPTSNILPLVTYGFIAYTGGALSSFLCNKYWTFRRRQKTIRREVQRFVLVLLLEAVLNSGLTWLIGQALQPLLSNPQFWGNATKLLVLAISTLLSYLCMRFWVFAREPLTDEA